MEIFVASNDPPLSDVLEFYNMQYSKEIKKCWCPVGVQELVGVLPVVSDFKQEKDNIANVLHFIAPHNW